MHEEHIKHENMVCDDVGLDTRLIENVRMKLFGSVAVLAARNRRIGNSLSCSQAMATACLAPMGGSLSCRCLHADELTLGFRSLFLCLLFLWKASRPTFLPPRLRRRTPTDSTVSPFVCCRVVLVSHGLQTGHPPAQRLTGRSCYFERCTQLA